MRDGGYQCELLDLAIANGETILHSGAGLSGDTLRTWYESAEGVLQKLLGDTWTEIVHWETYSDLGSPEASKDRLARALGYLGNARNLLSAEAEDSVPRSTAERNSTQPEAPQVFIVHGHDDATKFSVKNYLQNTLHLPEPIILHEQPSHGKTIIEKFEEHSERADLAFVLLTPDDRIADPTNDQELHRARQNVILELGFFYGRLGRKSGRVFLLHKGKLDIPSDLSGIVYIDISDGVAAAGEKIRRELDQFMPW